MDKNIKRACEIIGRLIENPGNRTWIRIGQDFVLDMQEAAQQREQADRALDKAQSEEVEETINKSVWGVDWPRP